MHSLFIVQKVEKWLILYSLQFSKKKFNCYFKDLKRII